MFTWDQLGKNERDGLRSIVSDGELDESRVRVLEVGRRPQPFWLTGVLGTSGVLLLCFAVKLFRRER